MAKTEARAPRSFTMPVASGLAVIVLGVGGFFGWAAVAPLASAVMATSRIAIETNRKKLQHPVGGVVRELLVRDGNSVDAGDVLIRLDDTEPKARLGIIQSNYDTARATLARLVAERDEAETITYPDDLHAASIRAVLAAFSGSAETIGENRIATEAVTVEPFHFRDRQTKEILKGQTAVFVARRASLVGGIDLLHQRIEQLWDEIAGLVAQQEALEGQQALIEEEISVARKLVDQGLAIRSRLLEREREAKRLQGDHGATTAKIAQAQKSIGEAKLQIVQQRQTYREKVVDEWRQTQTELSDLEERLTAAKHQVQNVELRAPVSGTIVGMQVHTVGGVIQPGATVLEIVPLEDRLIAEARVEITDIDNLTIGQRADVRLTGLKQRLTPSLAGQITYLSADALTDQHSGHSYYRARIEVTEAELAKLGGVLLQPGMPAEVTINTGERTALRYLAQPILDSMRHAWREE